MCSRWKGKEAQGAECEGFGTLSWGYRTMEDFTHWGNLFIVHWWHSSKLESGWWLKGYCNSLQEMWGDLNVKTEMR